MFEYLWYMVRSLESRTFKFACPSQQHVLSLVGLLTLQKFVVLDGFVNAGLPHTASFIQSLAANLDEHGCHDDTGGALK